VSVLVAAAPLAIPLYRYEYAATQGETIIWSPVCIVALFIMGWPFWAKGVHRLERPWESVGIARPLRWARRWLIAFGGGAAGVAGLYLIQLALGWGVWGAQVNGSILRHLLEGLLVAIGVGVVEELVFRGWLLLELERDYSRSVALWVNAILFAIAHYLRPIAAILATWPQFFGLLLLGLTLVWARRIPLRNRRSRVTRTTLAYAAGLHGGLVWAYYQVDVNDWVVPSGQVPDWVTGVGGNPLAGLLGLGLLGAIATVVYIASHVPRLR